MTRPALDLLSDLAPVEPDPWRDAPAREIAEVAAKPAEVVAYEDESPNDPIAEWRGMPAFRHGDLTAVQKIVVHFKTVEDVQRFAELIGQPLTDSTRAIWYPPDEIRLYGVAR